MNKGHGGCLLAKNGMVGVRETKCMVPNMLERQPLKNFEVFPNKLINKNPPTNLFGQSQPNGQNKTLTISLSRNSLLFSICQEQQNQKFVVLVFFLFFFFLSEVKIIGVGLVLTKNYLNTCLHL